MNDITPSNLTQAIQQLVIQELASPNKGGGDLHQLVLDKVHAPLLQTVMGMCKFNQSRAAKKLGISRGMLRTLLIKYFDNQYCRNEKDA